MWSVAREDLDQKSASWSLAQLASHTADTPEQELDIIRDLLLQDLLHHLIVVGIGFSPLLLKFLLPCSHLWDLLKA